MTTRAVDVRPILGRDASQVSEFLHAHLNTRVSASAWQALFSLPWGDESADHGYQLLCEGEVVGVYVAVNSRRTIDGELHRVCNLAAFCILPDFRMHALRLVRAVLRQSADAFTDFSPSGNVVAMNERLGFTHLQIRTRLAVNVPVFSARGTHTSEDPRILEATLIGEDAALYRDHRQAPAARHVVITHEDSYAYMIYRRDRRKNLPLFASPLYVGGDRELLRHAWGQVRAHLLRRGLVFTLADERVLGFSAGPGITLPRPRAKMVRGDYSGIDDYLYSELTLVSW